MFDEAHNDTILNVFNSVILMAWLANIDFFPYTTLSAVVNYVAKYASKSETATASYHELASKILLHVFYRSSMLFFVSKMMNKIAVERDYLAQEVTNHLLQLPLVTCSRVIIQVDCRNPKDQQRYIINDERIQETLLNYQKYLAHDEEVWNNLTYF
jgi:hypothetical protein